MRAFSRRCFLTSPTLPVGGLLLSLALFGGLVLSSQLLGRRRLLGGLVTGDHGLAVTCCETEGEELRASRSCQALEVARSFCGLTPDHHLPPLGRPCHRSASFPASAVPSGPSKSYSGQDSCLGGGEDHLWVWPNGRGLFANFARVVPVQKLLATSFGRGLAHTPPPSTPPFLGSPDRHLPHHSTSTILSSSPSPPTSLDIRKPPPIIKIV